MLSSSSSPTSHRKIVLKLFTGIRLRCFLIARARRIRIPENIYCNLNFRRHGDIERRTGEENTDSVSHQYEIAENAD